MAVKRSERTGEIIPHVEFQGVYHNWPWRVVSDLEPEEWTLWIKHYDGWKLEKFVPVGITRDAVEEYLNAEGFGR